MGKSFRAERMAEEIKKVVSQLLLREIKDPRLSGMVSISDVEVSKDYGYATIYISVPESDNREEVLKAFEGAKGLVRKEVGRQIKLRHVPEINFRLDTSQEYGRHIESILESLNIKSGEDESEEEKELTHDEE